MALTTDQKNTVDKLTASGKTCKDIKKITGLEYKNLYSYINRLDIAETAKRQYKATPRVRKVRNVATTVNSKYVDTGRAMPPTYRSELKIIADKELAELACQQMGLKPPVCPLAKRPMSYNANGWVWNGDKFVAGLAVHNDGMLTRQPAFTAGR